MNNAAVDLLQGELERLYDLDALLRLSSDVLGFSPAAIGGTGTKGAFARSLVAYCQHEDAVPALIDAIMLTSESADTGLREVLKTASNGDLAPGTEVGTLKVIRKLAEGGLSVVYLAETAAGERAALKVIRPEYARDRAAVHRFTTVARVLSRVRAPGLAPILSVGTLEGARPWVAAELVSGEALSERIKRLGPLHVNDARPIFQGVLQGLIALHKRGLVHGDVKAENVFVVTASGSAADQMSSSVTTQLDQDLTAVLVDAGEERLVSRAGGAPVNVASILPLVGTAKAMSPEQARGQAPDARCDVYAFGALMYETLTGRPPFVGDSAIEVIAQHVSKTPEPPSMHARRGRISDALDELMLRLLAKDPKERFADATAVMDAFEHVMRQPARRRPLDEVAFVQLRNTLVREPGNEDVAEMIEGHAHDSGAWDRASTVFSEAARAASDTEVRLSLLYRAARIYESEIKNPLRSEAVYQQILQLRPGDQIALHGIESARRHAGDYTGLLEVLLQRADDELPDSARTGLLHEIATLYEEKLLDGNNAVISYAKALVHDPNDVRALRSIERLTANHETRLGEALGVLSTACQEQHKKLLSDEQLARRQALRERDAARAQLESIKAKLAAGAESRAERDAQMDTVEDDDDALAITDSGMGTNVAEMEERLASLNNELSARVAERDTLVERLNRAAKTVQETQAAHDATTNAAAQVVERYERLEDQQSNPPQEAETRELAALAQEVDRLVEQVTQRGNELNAAQDALAALQLEIDRTESTISELLVQRTTLDDELVRLRATTSVDFVLDDVSASLLQEVDPQDVTAAEERLAAAEREVRRLGEDDAERAARRARETTNLVHLYLILGRMYSARLGRADFALACYGRALEVDPDNTAAFDLMVEVYRNSQAYTELANALLTRAERSQNPVLTRDYRVQAGLILAQKLQDEPRAREQLQLVLEQDPAHDRAYEALAGLYESSGDVYGLVDLMERRMGALEGDAKFDSRLALAQLYEERLGEQERAEAHYLAVAEAAPRKLEAWKGLERIYARKQNYEGLLNALRSQIELAPTPRQKIALYDQIGRLLEEEFVDAEAAADSYEQIVSIDPGNEVANLALSRLYRQLGRYEDVVEVLTRLATNTRDPKQKVGYLIETVQTYNADIGAPERALAVCERILEIDPQEPEALSEIARLKSTAGDVASAVAAIERLADSDPERRAEHFVRAGKLLEDSGDRDGAIGRYKKALDADHTSLAAVDALRTIYTRRGDAHGAIEMLNHAIALTEGDRKRAELYAERGIWQADKLENENAAEASFTTALTLDSTCTKALIGLGRIEFNRQHYDKSAGYLGVALGSLDELPRDEAAQVCANAAESFAELGLVDKAVDGYKRARDLLPDDLHVNERYAAIVLASGDARAAERLYERIYRRFDDEFDMNERLRVLRGWGEAQLESGRINDAITTFKDVLSRKSDDDGALAGLTRAYKANGQYQDVINLLQLRSRLSDDPEQRFNLLVETGDVFLEKIEDRDAAAQTYVMALDQQPQNRNLLTKLMAVYSDSQDWSRLIEVILRIAGMVDSPEQLAKYYNTAANIAHKQLGRYDEAANYYEAALTHLPPEQGHSQLLGLVECLTENQDWERLERAYATRYERLANVGAHELERAEVLDARGRVLAEQLGRTQEAVELYELAQQLEPDNRQRREMLTAVYTKEPKRYFQRAVSAHRAQLIEDPYRIESLQALRRIYTSAKRPDESWCLCQALRCLKMADVDEEKFFKKYRLQGLPLTQRPLDEELYRAYVWHPLQDPGVTSMFTVLYPAIVALQSQPLAAFGVDPRAYADPAVDPTPIVRMLRHVADVSGQPLPELYHCPDDAGGLSFLFSSPPAIGIGVGARAHVPPQGLAFVAARHVSYYRTASYIRQLVPTGTGLRAWLFGAIRLISPQFPVPAQMETVVRECVEAIRTHLTGPQRDTLRSLTQKLLEAAPELDMRRWMAGVDLSADRMGLLMGNDLKYANAVVENSPDEAAVVSKKDRLRELLAYSVSEEYFEVRKALGIALGGS